MGISLSVVWLKDVHPKSNPTSLSKTKQIVFLYSSDLFIDALPNTNAIAIPRSRISHPPTISYLRQMTLLQAIFSPFTNLEVHFQGRTLFIRLRILVPKPPLFLFKQIVLQLTKWIFLSTPRKIPLNLLQSRIHTLRQMEEAHKIEWHIWQSAFNKRVYPFQHTLPLPKGKFLWKLSSSHPKQCKHCILLLEAALNTLQRETLLFIQYHKANYCTFSASPIGMTKLFSKLIFNLKGASNKK